MVQQVEQQKSGKKNILFLVLTLGVGGAERQTEDLVNGLDKDKFGMYVLYLREFDRATININPDKLNDFQYIKRSGKLDFSAVSKIKAYILKNHIDIVFCVEEFPFLMAYLVRVIYGIPFSLITCLHHTKPFPGIWEGIKDHFYHFLLNRNDQVVFVSQNQKDYWVKQNGINPAISTVIHNGVDMEYFSTEQVEKAYPDCRNAFRARLGIATDQFVIGINAFLREGKRHTDLIEAIHICHQRGYTKISACIIGRGPQQEHIETCIQNYHMQDSIILAGFQKDVRPYVQLCDCLCLPSDSEAFSMASLEAMALGKPVIMSDVGGANEQILEGLNGFLFQPGDVAQFARLIIKIYEQPEYRQADRIRQSVSERFSLTVMLAKYQKLFQSIS